MLVAVIIVKLVESGNLCTLYEKRNKTIRVWNDGVFKFNAILFMYLS